MTKSRVGRRLHLLLALAVAVALVAAACGSDDSTAAPAPAPEPAPAPVPEPAPAPEETGPCAGIDIDKMGYTPLTMEFDYFLFTVQGMEEAASACGVDVIVDDPGLDAAAQVAGIENMITAGIDAVAIVSVDPIAIEAGVESARAAGIPVVSQVSTFEGADVYVGLPEHEFGRLAGDLGGQWLTANKPGDAPYEVAILNADSLGEGLLDRKQGLIDGLEAHVTDYELVSDVEAFAEETALDAVSTILLANPDLDLLLTVNDPGMLGAAAAVEAAGLELSADMAIVGVGIDQRVLQGVLDGLFPGSVSPEPVSTGRTLVEVAFSLLRGEDVPRDVEVPPVQITESNAQDFIDLLYG